MVSAAFRFKQQRNAEEADEADEARQIPSDLVRFRAVTCLFPGYASARSMLNRLDWPRHGTGHPLCR
jgi:hypothetical protein